MLDYRVLPFISVRTPYLESLRIPSEADGGRHRRPRPRVRLVRLEPRAALRLGHQRLAAAGSRVRAGGASRANGSGTWSRYEDRQFRVHYLNDRSGIYALGYPLLDPVRSRRQPRGARHPRLRAVPRAARRLDAVQRAHLAHAGQRPRAAARGALELLPQAVPGVRGRRRSCPSCSPRVRDPRLLRRAVHARRSRRERSGPRPSPSAWSRTTRRCSSGRRAHCVSSTTR